MFNDLQTKAGLQMLRAGAVQLRSSCAPFQYLCQLRKLLLHPSLRVRQHCLDMADVLTMQPVSTVCQQIGAQRLLIPGLQGPAPPWRQPLVLSWKGYTCRGTSVNGRTRTCEPVMSSCRQHDRLHYCTWRARHRCTCDDPLKCGTEAFSSTVVEDCRNLTNCVI